MTQTRSLTIFGATGSVGESTLNLVRECNGRFRLKGLTANSNHQELSRLALEFKPELVVIADDAYYQPLADSLTGTGIEVRAGRQALVELAREPVDCVVGAIVGIAGLAPVYAAVQAGQQIALANKETLVAAGHIIMPLLAQTAATILPVDSEHSAIFQCLRGEQPEAVEDITLTASGGPFRQLTRQQMISVSREQALAHPNWSMGQKVTIDSATLMNKGLELIEAKWLFGLAPDRIKAVIHPQSVIHGLVNFKDGSCLAHLGAADMRIPISYALDYPNRLAWQAETLDLVQLAQLDFAAIDFDRFPCFALARQAMAAEPEAAVILNAANEIAVAAFLADQISYLQIADVVDSALTHFSGCAQTTNIDDVICLDQDVRRFLSAQPQLC